MTRHAAGFVTLLRNLIYGIWAWFVFTICIVYALLVAIVVPHRTLRGKLLAGAARGIFIFSGTKVSVSGSENLPAGHCVVVPNHASYVDGFLLKGYLPARFAFVIKGEMRKVPVVHFLIRRSGSHLVERFEAAGSARDARRIVKAAKGGESFVIFPEGTFREYPGLARFRPGAFVAAIKGQMPIVPVVIHGTRQMMPGGVRMPKHVPLDVQILPPIMPDHAAFTNHRELAEAARRQILDKLDEPDLCA